MASIGDDSFGPQLPGAFDFTLYFEQTILTILPASIFILTALWRMVNLWSRKTCTASPLLLLVKLVGVGCLGAIQLSVIALWGLPSTSRTAASIPAAVVAFLATALLGPFIFMEHRRSPKPAAIASGYLLLTAVLDLAQARSLWLRGSLNSLAALFTVCIVLKVVVLACEESSKLVTTGEKEMSKESHAGLISRSVFFWLNRFLFLGSKVTLGVGDIGSIHFKFDSDALLQKLENQWNASDKQGKYDLLLCTFKAFRGQFLAGVVPRLLFSAFTFSQPFLISTIVGYIEEPAEVRDVQVGKSLIGATILIYAGMAVTNGLYHHMTYQMTTMYRGALVSLVYKKTLLLEPTSIKESAPTTLMSTDVEGIATGLNPIHDIWAAFLELPVALFLLYRQVGIPSLFILIPAILTTLLGGILSPKLGPARIIWNKAIQERIGDTSSMLRQIKGVKMMGLTEYFHNRLATLRSDELKRSVKFRILVIALNTLATTTQMVTPVIVILAAIFWSKADEGLSVSEAFTSLSIVTIAATPINNILVSMLQLFGVVGCFSRLQEFLKQPDRTDPRQSVIGSQMYDKSIATSEGTTKNDASAIEMSSLSDLRSDQEDIAIRLSGATFAVPKAGDVLHDISMEVKRATLSMIVGRVGCGKSSLLKAMAGELDLKSGTVETSSTEVAYCDQTPWIPNISIRDNVVGQSIFDELWFESVVSACGLDEDIKRFRNGTSTIVGSGGISLSGGQKQRLALARAVYARKRIVLLDDVFSGLDNKTSRRVFQRLLSADGLLRRDNRTVVLVTNHLAFLPAADCITMLDAGRIIHNQAEYNALEPSEWGVLDSDGTSSSSDLDDDYDEAASTDQSEESKAEAKTKEVEEVLGRQAGDWACYKIYFKALGWITMGIVVPATLIGVIMENLPTVMLKLWTQNGGSKDTGLGYLGGYVGFSVGSVIVIMAGLGHYFIYGIPRSANKLHLMLLETVMRAPLYFFTQVDNGVTLNRFSQDMSLLDQALPMSFFATLALSCAAATQAGIILSGSSYLGAILPAGIIALYLIQRYYLKTSRQIRFLDLEMKSPLYTQFSETLAGLSTIRAFGWSSASRMENSARLNTSQKPFYMLFCIQRWLQVVLDLFSGSMAVVLVAFALMIPQSSSGAALALAMVNIISFNFTLSNVINSWTQLETSLGAIARLKWFMENTPREQEPTEEPRLPSNWPSSGEIEFKNVTASYSAEGDSVLKNVSFKIKPGQKVGVCGRSGSGKSSLISVLARLLELKEDASIIVDGVDISTIRRQTLRSCLAALPQDALSLSGTVRRNLDPSSAVPSDEMLISALTKVAIWPFIESRGGLDASMDEVGLSAGQLQLFSLARVILRGKVAEGSGSVVLLDEATSNVDRRTDDEVRATLRADFDGRTVIEVAHHLDIVRHYDVIIVLGAGEMLEIGSPDELLANPKSEFYALWASRGL